jgi:hypothetical protein
MKHATVTDALVAERQRALRHDAREQRLRRRSRSGRRDRRTRT